MNRLRPKSSSNLTPAHLNPLEECSEESIYAPGYIQPHGIVLTLQQPELKILQVSENVEQFFGISAEELLNQPLQRLFPKVQVKRIVEFLKQEQLELCNPFELKINRGVAQDNLKKPTKTFLATLYQTPDVIILELAPLIIRKNSNLVQSHQRLQGIILRLRQASSLLAMAQMLTREVKILTGFDRVMVYRVEPDDHGVVIAETKENHLESYLGLHYPASDMPVATRQLFERNLLRQIPDINYTPAHLIPKDHPLTKKPLDLSSSQFRGVTPCHIQYLQNMGVTATLNISLIKDQHLWGLIACHHYSSNLLDYETLKTCEFLGQLAAIELVHQEERALNTYRQQIKAIQDELQKTFFKDSNFFEIVLSQNNEQLLNLVHAQGAAILLNNSVTLVGQTPSEKEIKALVKWLSKKYRSGTHAEGIFVTDSLSQLYPTAKKFKDKSSGVLAISILLSRVQQKSYHILWFRPEQIQTVNWAGKAEDAVEIDTLGKMQLCPRKSFELWKETVREKSYPWQMVELEAAVEMRNTLMVAVLDFSQAVLEKTAERAMLASRAKSQFLAKMSHELRTPLNSILGFTKIMNRHTSLPKDFQEYLDIINRSGEHLLNLINDVLQMSKIEAGQLALTESCFDVLRLIRSLEEMFVFKANEKGLWLKIEQEQNIPRYVYGDEAKLRQILINLLSNAIKFTQTGGVTLQVSVVTLHSSLVPKAMADSTYGQQKINDHQKPLNLKVEVVDTGCGIAAGELEGIFEAFMQTERGRYVEGTGLGLSISRQFARLMGGDITVTSTPNQGSTFTCEVILYLPKSLDLVEAEPNQLVIGLEPGQPTYRILIAEDMSETGKLMLLLLQSVGFEVDIVDNGSETVARWQAWQPDLIFMDIQMPVMNGYEATRVIRAEEAASQLQPTPIIALTAYAFEDNRTACLEVGCNDHIAKPFSENKIFEVIAHYLGVRYRYREKTSQEQFPSESRILTAPDLRVMPREWLEQVHEAALDLNDTKVRQLLDQIPPTEKYLFEAMRSLVDNFHLEQIATLTQF